MPTEEVKILSDVRRLKIGQKEQQLEQLREDIRLALNDWESATDSISRNRLQKKIDALYEEAQALENELELLHDDQATTSESEQITSTHPARCHTPQDDDLKDDSDAGNAISKPDLNSPETLDATTQSFPEKITHRLRDTFQLSKLGRFKKRTISASFATAVGIVLARSVGLLEGSELKLYDQFLKYRPSEPIDEHILVIGITQRDLDLKQEYEERLGRTCTSGVGSLPDCVYDELLKTLEPHTPKVIGLDLYRADLVGNGFEAAPDSPVLARYLSGEGVAPLFSVCKASIPEINLPGIAPPLESPLEHIGFSDFVGGQESDDELITRRHLLWMNVNPAADERGNPCASQYSFNLAIASYYLGIDPQFEDEDKQSFQLTEEISIPKINSNSGGYQAVDASGYQTLLNYRAHKERTSNQRPSPIDAISQMSLADALNNTDKRLETFVPGNIVLIGRVDDNSGDLWRTPYSQSLIPGVIIQAQMISQIVSAVEDDRAFLTTWNELQEYSWIWLWFGAGLLIYILFSSKRSILFISLSSSMLGLIIVALFFFYQQSTWIPIFPCMLMLVTPTLISYVVYTQFDKND